MQQWVIHMHQERRTMYTQSYDELEKQYAKLLNKFSSWYIPNMDRDDIKQELRAVLFKANNQFDSTKNVRFLTYLYTAFNNTIKKLSYRSMGQNTYTPQIPISIDDCYNETVVIPDMDPYDSDLFEIVGLASPNTQLVAQLLTAGFSLRDLQNVLAKQDIQTALAELKRLLKREK